jgi:hypothetical protein
MAASSRRHGTDLHCPGHHCLLNPLLRVPDTIGGASTLLFNGEGGYGGTGGLCLASEAAMWAQRATPKCGDGVRECS